MTMHLEGPWLTTTGKKKGKKKWASAEQKRKAEELDRSWKELQKKWAADLDKRNRTRALSAPPLESPKPFRRETPYIASLNGGIDRGPALKAPEKVYTGTKVKGIGTLHKSNAVPIFSDEEAVDISRMRR
jgi:hypothetical protein